MKHKKPPIVPFVDAKCFFIWLFLVFVISNCFGLLLFLLLTVRTEKQFVTVPEPIPEQVISFKYELTLHPMIHESDFSNTAYYGSVTILFQTLQKVCFSVNPKTL